MSLTLMEVTEQKNGSGEFYFVLKDSNRVRMILEFHSRAEAEAAHAALAVAKKISVDP